MLRVFLDHRSDADTSFQLFVISRSTDELKSLFDRSGIRLLRLLDLSALFDAAESAEWGVLNLLGLGNPLASKPANYLVWGQVAGWTSSYYVVWGSTIQDPSGQYVVWGSSDVTDGSYVVWGSSLPGSDGSTR